MNRFNIPSHFDLWDGVLQELMNNLSLGTPESHLLRWNTHYRPAGAVLTGHAEGPPPAAPSPNAAVHYLTMLVSMKEVAETMENRESGREFEANIESSVARFIDDYCGTPWPLPGGPPWAAILAAELVSAANLHTGPLRAGLLRLAGRVAERAFSAAQTVAAGS
jgi:hypothetical protein